MNAMSERQCADPALEPPRESAVALSPAVRFAR